MSFHPRCKITVIKRTVNKDLIDEYMEPALATHDLCSKLKEGDEFFTDSEWQMPEGFCPWAWADIRKDILGVMNNASFHWIKEPNMAIAGCTDWFKPVIFKIEKF